MVFSCAYVQPSGIASFTPIASFVFVVLTGVAGAQTPTPRAADANARGQTPAPAPASARVASRVLTLEECVAIALEAAAAHQATLADYAAARIASTGRSHRCFHK
jgi:hypothetical protein